MGRELAERFPTARQAFQEVDRALGFSLSRLCFDGPAEELQQTANTQPAILAASVAAAEVLRSQGIKPDIVAGHSLGEYSALVVAGSLSLFDAARLVHKRGEYMQEAVPVGVGAMAAVLGLNLETVNQICREAAQGETVSAANLNAPAQIVIAGHKTAVERAVELAKSRGAKRVTLLNVSAPFHCALMRPAAERLGTDLDAVEIADAWVPLVNNVDAAVVSAADAVRDGLKRQVTAPVRWTDCVARLLGQGAETFIEVGPGKVLSGLLRQIHRDARVTHVEDLASLKETLAVLGGH
jgi:[acyl-carrier-protein] S-malonyltransferase